MWKDQPDGPDLYYFRGLRISQSKKFVTQVDTIVKVAEEKGYPEPVVYYHGSGKAYRINQHQGKWRKVGDMFNE